MLDYSVNFPKGVYFQHLWNNKFFEYIWLCSISHRTEWVVRYQSSRLAQNSIWFCLQDSYIVTPVIGIMSKESNREYRAFKEAPLSGLPVRVKRFLSESAMY